MMKFFRTASAVALMLAAFAGTAAAQAATQNVSYTVSSINDVNVSGNPGALTITTTAVPATDNTTTYSVETNSPSTAPKKITAALNADMEAGLTLQVELTAPTTVGVSAGPQALSMTAVEVVGSLYQVSESGLAITYTLTANAMAAAATSSKTVTFTITDDV